MWTVDELSSLNEYQKAAVLDNSNACMVNANVGSGKTTVLIQKILYLHYKKNVPYENMVVLTFTNKAANEIKERLFVADTQVDESNVKWFGTFHGVCLALLKEFLPVEELGYTKDFVVMLPEEELEMAEQLIQEKGLKIKYKNRLRKRLEKAMAIQKEEQKISRYQDDIFILTELIQSEKKKQNKMTYLDLLEHATCLIGKSQITPQWIIVDEIQDSDEIQLKLLQQMKRNTTSLFVVGDPNQVIYSWRGSTLDVFFRFREMYQAKELTLPINYRSTGAILEAARYFLQRGDRIEGVKEMGSRIVVKNHYNPFQEADYLAERIRQLHEEGVTYGNIAIFYRLQNQAKTLEDVFQKNEIPYEVSLKRNIADIPVLNWLLKVLRFAVNPHDFTSAIGALTNSEYGEGLSVKAATTQLQIEESDSELLGEMRHFQAAFTENYSAEEVYQYFQLDRRLKPNASTYEEDHKLVYMFLSHIGTRCEETRKFINESALYGMNLFDSEIDDKEDSVKLMTLHTSKGLEFTHVFIIGVNYGLIPLRTKGVDADEEERRLFFVGITRAKEYLELSYYTSPEQYRVSPGPSSYLSMIPERLVMNEAAGKPVQIDIQDRLQQIKKQILEARGEVKYLFPEEEQQQKKDRKESNHTNRRVRHAKYGEGEVVSEDDVNITVNFKDYGEKEFLKMFSELEEI